MIPVSQEYLDNIYKDETQTYCTASFGLYDLNAKSQATVTASSEYLSSGKETEFTSPIVPTTWDTVSAPWSYNKTNYFGQWSIYANWSYTANPIVNGFDGSTSTTFKTSLNKNETDRYYQLTCPIGIKPIVIRVRHKIDTGGTDTNCKVDLYGYTNGEWEFIANLPTDLSMKVVAFQYNGDKYFTKFKCELSSTLNRDVVYTLSEFTIASGYIRRNSPENTIDGIVGDTSSIWMSGEVSNSSGYFTSNPWIEYSWNEDHSSSGLQLYFNTKIRQAEITYYNSSDQIIDTYELNGEADTWTIENQVNNYRKIKIEFIRTYLINARIRMQEINFGIEYTFNEDIISIDIEECVDNKMQELASGKCTLKLNDIDKRFNQYNPSSLFQYIEEGQRVQIVNHAIIDGNIESVPLGVFYLSSWKNDTEFTITFDFNDILYRFAGRNFIRSTFIRHNATSSFISAKTYLTNMFNDFNTTYGDAIQYEIDDALDDIKFGGYLGVEDYRTALQKVCIASRAVAYSNRDGKITVKQLDATNSVETLDYKKKTYSTTETLEKYGAVTVNYTTGLGYSDDVREVFDKSVNGDLTVSFKEPMDRVTVTGADSYEIYANCVDVHTISSKNVTIEASPLTIWTKTPVKASNYSADSVTNLEITLQDITIITLEEQASAVATWLLAELQKNLKLEFQWIANPAIEVGDLVLVQVGDTQYKTAQILKNKFTFNGALEETSEFLVTGEVTAIAWDDLTETYWSEFNNKNWMEVGYVSANT